MRWIDTPASLSLAPLPDLHPLVSQTLTRRGIITSESARAFLDPTQYSPAPPSALPGLTTAVECIKKAIRSREPICVWGDFDVDGQTATTILVQTLQALGANVTYHIPVRGRESHGVNIPYLQEIIDNAAKLILTCDTGITAHDAVEYARMRGVEVVITDHHDLPETLPQAAAVVNPKLLPEDHPLVTLSGAGVAYKLAEAMLDDRPQTIDHRPSSELLDLAALGLVADLALLRGDCRYLVQKGLEALRNTKRLGLQVMMEIASLQPANINEEHIGFVLGPRLNALGRLGDANPSVELLTTSDAGRARLLATQLENYNMQRQLLTSQVTRAAESLLRADPSLLTQPIIILSHPSWPDGVIGIAAARLVERYRKPFILLSAPEGEPARGSVRSEEGINITAAIAAQRDLLLNFGGHPMAAGLSLVQENLPEFRRRLARTVEKMLGEAARDEPELQIDCWLNLPDVNLELAEALEKLAPFGPSNEKPILATRGLMLQSAVLIGRNKEHRKLTVADEAGNAQQVFWWDGGEEELPEGTFDLAYTVRASDWRGVRQIQLALIDFRVVEEKPIEVKRRQVEIIDYRNVENPIDSLAHLNVQALQRENVRAAIWAEGEVEKKAGWQNRDALERANMLIIWTIPPSPEVLRTVMEKVQPEKVVLFAINPPTAEPKTFLERLAGLVKYAINKRSGRANLAELAAATAQRGGATIRIGLEWLAAGGQVNVEVEGEDLRLSTSNQTPNPYLQKELGLALKTLLDETAAYRAYFARADRNALII